MSQSTILSNEPVTKLYVLHSINFTINNTAKQTSNLTLSAPQQVKSRERTTRFSTTSETLQSPLFVPVNEAVS